MFPALRDFFSENFFPKGSPLQFLHCFASEWMLETPKVFFSALWDFFLENNNSSLFNFLMFCDRMDVEKPQRLPLSVIRHCETFLRKFVFLQRVPPSTATKMLTISEVSPFSAQGARGSGPRATLGPFFAFSIFEYSKLNLWRRLEPVSTCCIWTMMLPI